MTRVFLFGTLQDDDLRRIVTGADVAVSPANLPGHTVWKVAGAAYPALQPDPAELAAGVLTAPLSVAAAARIDFYEACFGYAPRRVQLCDGAAVAHFPAEPQRSDGTWDLGRWQTGQGAIAREVAREVMEHHGHRSPGWVGRRFSQILSRADAAVRAAREAPPQDVRRGLGRADVEVLRHRRPYTDFFSLVEQELRFRRFDGTWSDVVTRSTLMASDAVTVLPYDPVRDEVLLVEQFRHGPFVRGDRAPWAVEPIAGRIDPGETPETTARREAKEEAGLELARLEKVGRYYASTGCLSEYVISFLGICDLSGLGGAVAGAAEEHEDILSHVLSFDRLMEIVASGEAEDAPLLVTAWWLASNRGRLRLG